MHFSLPLDPIPCPRPRIRVIRSKSGKSFASAYYPAAYAAWKVRAKELLDAVKMPYPFTRALHLTATFTVTRPKSTILDAPKPDIDNYLKSLMDACTAAGLWVDDSQVTQVDARKRWAAPGEAGLITFTVSPISP